MTTSHAGFTITDDRTTIDWPRVHGWLASSYWTPGIALSRLQQGTAASALVMSAFDQHGQQVGFGRVVSDTTRFAYLCDIWVDEPSRGHGLARALVQFAMAHPLLVTIDLWCLRTLDAHEVYTALGFSALTEPWKWMERRKIP
jgi:ribosomal protein S18 acetylase RimI-like enzyme